MNQTVNRKGFALVIVLVLLTIAGVSLGMIARRSHVQTIKVVESEEILQRKWLVRSCEKYVLQQAAIILDPSLVVSDANIELEEASGLKYELVQPASSQNITIDLIKRQLQIVLSNEDAKVNINKLLSAYSPEKIQKLLRDAVSENRNMMANIKLRLPQDYRGLSNEEGDQTEQEQISEVANSHMSVKSYEQIYDKFEPEFLFEDQWLTCWSDGMLDYRTAKKQALRVMLEHELGMNRIDKLISLREEEPELEFSRILTQLDLNRSQREYIGKVMVDQSASCYGMLLGIFDQRRQYVTWTVSKHKQAESEVLEGESKKQNVKLKRFVW